MALTPRDLVVEAWNNENRPTEKPEPINFE